MPLSDYGVLVGAAVDRVVETDQDTPHYQVRVRAGGIDYRVAVNVRSAQDPPDLLFLADDAFAHPVTAAVSGLSDGYHHLPSAPGGAALDFIRGNLFDRSRMRALPSSAPGPDNDLSDRIDHYVSRAIADQRARVYAFGERWGPEANVTDKVFGFRPGNGVHDIHMNQGNSGPYVRDDGVWQDGALLIHFPEPEQWVGFFMAFQSQAWHTDDTTGHALDVVEPERLDRRVRIVGALVNPVGPAPEAETVTLLNASDAEVSLAGWSIADRMKRRSAIEGQTLAAGATARVPVRAPASLGNSGGLITLLDADGLKVDGVSYTQADARDGWTVVF